MSSNQQVVEARNFGAVLEQAKPQLSQANPSLDINRFIRIVQTVVTQNPRIMECDRQSLFLAVMDCAAFGLEPDPKVGHIDILPVYDPVLKRKVAQARPRYGGYIEMARRSGEVASISPPRVVYEGDHFRFGTGADGLEFLEHEQDFKHSREERGDWYAIYVICNLKETGSRPIYEVMRRDEIMEIRDRKSESWAAFKAKKIKSTPWKTDELEMAKKTVVRRARKYWPMSMEDKRRLAEMEEMDIAGEEGNLVHRNCDGQIFNANTGTPIDIYAEEQEEQETPSSDNLDNLAKTAAVTGPGLFSEDFDPKSGEDKDDDPVQLDEQEAQKWLDFLFLTIRNMKSVALIEAHLSQEITEKGIQQIAAHYPEKIEDFTEKVNKHKKIVE